MKCRECGNELLTGDRYWQMGLCNECWSAYRFFNKSIPLDNPYEKRIEELQKQLAEKDKEIEEQIATNKEMDKMIGEKDKEIEKLKAITSAIKTATDAGIKVEDLISIDTNDIRHQVCEEIREKAKDIAYYEYDWLVLSLERLEEEILDQIEKGESK